MRMGVCEYFHCRPDCRRSHHCMRPAFQGRKVGHVQGIDVLRQNTLSMTRANSGEVMKFSGKGGADLSPKFCEWGLQTSQFQQPD